MIAKFILTDDYRRPVFTFRVGNRHYSALLDTGAEIPVFTLGPAMMRDIGGSFVTSDAWFTGFGGRITGDLYRIDIKIGSIKYRSLPVICIHDPTMKFEFILPATLFTGFCYTINDNAKMLTVDTLSSATEYRFKAADGRDVMVIFDEHPE